VAATLRQLVAYTLHGEGSQQCTGLTQQTLRRQFSLVAVPFIRQVSVAALFALGYNPQLHDTIFTASAILSPSCAFNVFYG
jgi:hypothetical protein